MHLREKLQEYKCRLGILKKIPISSPKERQKYVDMVMAGQPLPPGVYAGEYANFYQVQATDLSREELAEYLQCKQVCALETIKKCMIFFTTLTVISLIGALIMVYIALGV